MNCAWDRFLDEALLQPESLIANASFSVDVVDIGARRAPATIVRGASADTSWIASLANAYGPYARAELKLVGMPKAQRPLYALASHATQQVMHAAGLYGGAFLNNWLLATNLYGQETNAHDLSAASQHLAREHPDLPIILRSLAPALHRDLLADLARAGFLLIPTRQVWLASDLQGPDWGRRADVRRDLKLEERDSSVYDWADATGFSDYDFSTVQALYEQLYRRKYPHFNPSYTESFFRKASSTGFMKLTGLRNRSSGALAGVVGIINRDGVYATPVLGYDLAVSQDQGLYRRLMLKAFQEARHAGGVLHCSGGAGSFKKHRGARFEVEFAAVWANHLPLWRRGALHALHGIVKSVAVPYLQGREL